nr:YlxR family protein [Dictyobacter alpinus]
MPLRTCIACRENKSKRELLRVVRTPEGQVMIDATGKKSGRGAYLCAKLSCWQKALKDHRLEQVFETQISVEDRAALDEYVATLPKDEPEPSTAKTTKVPSSRKNAAETKA